MEGQFKKVSYVNSRRRTLHTVNERSEDDQYNEPFDSRFDVIVINERRESYRPPSNMSNNVMRRPVNYNKQSANVDFAVIERKIDEGTYDSEVDHDLVDKIKSARENTRMMNGNMMTQRDLAIASNLKESIIQNFEAGKLKLSGHDINKMKKALDIN
jgi:ribosome-binding protein aMBF1 (putative translation factor)